MAKRKKQPVKPSTKRSEEYLQRKQDMMAKEYESLFNVYGRQTTIVYNFRGWVIILLAMDFTYILTIKSIDTHLGFIPILFIIFSFYFLEVSERSIMKYLLKELRYLERIFMLDTTLEFYLEVERYEFRDLKDLNKKWSQKTKYFLQSMIEAKILLWNLFLILISLIIIHCSKKEIINSQKIEEKTQSIKVGTRLPKAKSSLIKVSDSNKSLHKQYQK